MRRGRRRLDLVPEPEPAEPKLSLRGVRKSFPTQRGGRVVALEDITFDVHPGEFVCLLAVAAAALPAATATTLIAPRHLRGPLMLGLCGLRLHEASATGNASQCLPVETQILVLVRGGARL